MLKHGVDVALMRRDPRHIGTFEADSAFGRILETGDHPQCGRLTASRWTQQGEKLSGPDREICIRYRDIVLEPFGDVIDFDDRFAVAPVGARASGGLRIGGASLSQGLSSSVAYFSGRG
jgi:hypothetical protein